MSKSNVRRLAIPSAIAVAILALVGCSGGGHDTNPAQGSSTAPMPAAVAPVTSTRSPLYNPAAPSTSMAPGATTMAPATAGTGDFASQAEQGGMFEIKLADLALSQSHSSEVKSFARKMKSDHTAADHKLQDIVGSSEQLPTHLTPDQQQTVNSLQSKSGTDFDKAYADAAVKNHQAAISLFENASSNAPSKPLQDFATQTLPTLKQHLQAAQQLQQKAGG